MLSEPVKSLDEPDLLPFVNNVELSLGTFNWSNICNARHSCQSIGTFLKLKVSTVLLSVFILVSVVTTCV